MKIVHREFLPSITRSCHAATVEIWNGHPVFSWFGGSREGAQDVCIYLHNLNGDGKTINIGYKDSMPRWNPILTKVNDQLFLFEKSGIFCDRWQTFFHNITGWTNDITEREIRGSQQVIPAGLNGPVKSRPLVVDGVMYCGSSVETPYDWSSYIEEFEIVDGKLVFKHRSRPLVEPNKVKYSNSRTGQTQVSLGIIQPTLWSEEPYAPLHAFFRSSNGLNKIYYAEGVFGSDGDAYWSKAFPTNLPNPNSAVDVAVCKGEPYLIWNPDAENRFPLVLSKFRKNSQTEFDILDSEVISDDVTEKNFMSLGCNTPELSYPYMVEDDGKLHIVYTYGRAKIEYVVVEVD